MASGMKERIQELAKRLRRAGSGFGFRWNPKDPGEVQLSGTVLGIHLDVAQKLEQERFGELTEGDLLEIESYINGFDAEVTAEIRRLARDARRNG